MSGTITRYGVTKCHRLALDPSQQMTLVYQKKRIKQTPPKSPFKGLTSSQLRKLQKEN